MADTALAPLRLVAVTHFPPMAGGSARSCALLFGAIARRGHQVHVLGPITRDTAACGAAPPAAGPETLTVSRYELPEMSLVQFDTGAFLEQQAREHEAVRARLPQLIDAVRPDVIVAAHETLGEAVVPLAHAKGLPCALLLRGSPTWQIATGVYPPALTARYLSLFRTADLVIPVAAYMSAALASQGVARLFHIPNLLDLEHFTTSPHDEALRATWGIPPGRIVVLHPSTMVSRKRAEDIVRAAALAAGDEPRLFYVFAGGEHRSAALEAMCAAGAAAGRVRFIPSVPYEDMPKLFHAADMVVMASEGEGMSRVYLEAQACGRVLIASDIPAAREVVRHGENGLLFPVGDVVALARQIRTAAGDAGMRERLGRAARERVRRHAIGDVAARYIEALSALRAGAPLTAAPGRR